MRLRSWSCCWLWFLFLLSACESSPTHLFTYAAAATEIQADRLVGQMLGKDVWPLPYRGRYGSVDISEPLARMQARFPLLKSSLEGGEVGLAASGEVVLREPDRASADLSQLVRDENRDRAIFYEGMCSAVGHDGGDSTGWLPYVRVTFGTAWQKQAQDGWWTVDGQGVWVKK